MAGEARSSLDPHANLNIHSTTMLVHWRAGDDVRSKKFGIWRVFSFWGFATEKGGKVILVKVFWKTCVFTSLWVALSLQDLLQDGPLPVVNGVMGPL